MTPGGFCYVQPLPEPQGFHVIHQRSNLSEAIMYPFLTNPQTATFLARELNLEIVKRLGSRTADELRRLARQLMAEDAPTLSEDF